MIQLIKTPTISKFKAPNPRKQRITTLYHEPPVPLLCRRCTSNRGHTFSRSQSPSSEPPFPCRQPPIPPPQTPQALPRDRRLGSHLSPLLQVRPLLVLLRFADFMAFASDSDPDVAAAMEVEAEDGGAGVIGGGGGEMERSEEPRRSESGEEGIGVDAYVENGGGGGIGGVELEMWRSEEPRRSGSGGSTGGGG